MPTYAARHDGMGVTVVAVGAFVLLFVALFAVSIGGIIFLVISLVEIVKIPDHQFRAAGSEKVTWVIVVALVGWIGALVWRFAKRAEVLAAATAVAAPPPGWYPDPSGQVRWWDGWQWTQHAGAPPAGPAAPPGG